MKFQSFVTATGISALAWVAAAAPDGAADPGLAVAEKSIGAWVDDLAHQKYRTREEASRKIWAIGDPALPELQEAASGPDPEQAYRARELIRKIQMHITPETDPEVVQLVERFDKALIDEKVNLFDKLYRKRAWRQILKLYAAEANPEMQSRLEDALRSRMAGVDGVAGVAVTAARECLLDGDAKAAREYLEMAPANPQGLLALADFHRSQGTLDAELERAKTLEGARGQAWQFALQRAAGNLDAARDAAEAAGSTRLSAAMAALAGDPLPWLLSCEVDAEGKKISSSYVELAIRRWQDKPIRPAELDVLARAANSRNRPSGRITAINSLFLLGEPALAEPAFLKNAPLEAFHYFEMLERIPDALKALGLDPEKPDYASWVEKRIDNISKGDGENEQDTGMDTQELALLAHFLEHRGMHAVAAEAYLKPLATFAENDAKNYAEFLGTLFGSSLRGGVLGAPQLARDAAVAWAGESDDRWEEVITAAFGGEDETLAIWDWLDELNPKSSRVERLDGLLALCGMGRDKLGLRRKWLDLAWDSLKKSPEEMRPPLLEMMSFLADRNPDVAMSLRIWEMLPEASRKEMDGDRHLMNLSAAGRWQEAADFFLKQIDLISKSSADPQPFFFAYAAACLRKAGRVEEATAQDALVDKLALGNDAMLIASAYAFGYDFKRAADWRARAARQSDPEDPQTYVRALESHLEALMEEGRWKEAGSVAEVLAQIVVSEDSISTAPLAGLKLRLQSDLGRALANLKTDRAGSIAMLARCLKMFPSDGSLADEFFPALRKMGLVKEHDEWFQQSWERMSAVVARFPDSDNTCNTAAWLAARAMRKLDEAEALEMKALANNPDQSAYLDTMAEIHFARGDRQKALEWSTKAVNFLPADPMLRRQHERFRTAPLPR